MCLDLVRGAASLISVASSLGDVSTSSVGVTAVVDCRYMAANRDRVKTFVHLAIPHV